MAVRVGVPVAVAMGVKDPLRSPSLSSSSSSSIGSAAAAPGATAMAAGETAMAACACSCSSSSCSAAAPFGERGLDALDGRGGRPARGLVDGAHKVVAVHLRDGPRPELHHLLLSSLPAPARRRVGLPLHQALPPVPVRVAHDPVHQVVVHQPVKLHARRLHVQVHVEVPHSRADLLLVAQKEQRGDHLAVARVPKRFPRDHRLEGLPEQVEPAEP
mmetsp:Transcript_14349/g.36193  ORF Transcript_14349/g.36193 Transcript_14349/m.36193 type:complete len:216 (+) Transcript_14349:219-866(+)